jgi:hypothetical protein
MGKLINKIKDLSHVIRGKPFNLLQKQFGLGHIILLPSIYYKSGPAVKNLPHPPVLAACPLSAGRKNRKKSHNFPKTVRYYS